MELRNLQRRVVSDRPQRQPEEPAVAARESSREWPRGERQSGGAAESERCLPFHLVVVDGVVAERLDECGQPDPHLQAGEAGAQAMMDPVAERER